MKVVTVYVEDKSTEILWENRRNGSSKAAQSCPLIKCLARNVKKKMWIKNKKQADLSCTC